MLDRDIIIECIKFAFKDEFDSTSIDEVLKSSIHFSNFQDFLKINTLSYTGRNAWVESLKNRVEHVFANDMPDDSFNSKQFTYIMFTHLILLCLATQYVAQLFSDEAWLSPDANFDEKIENSRMGF